MDAFVTEVPSVPIHEVASMCLQAYRNGRVDELEFVCEWLEQQLKDATMTLQARTALVGLIAKLRARVHHGE